MARDILASMLSNFLRSLIYLFHRKYFGLRWNFSSIIDLLLRVRCEISPSTAAEYVELYGRRE